MAQIQQLSPHVADLIAAGEVVERPASVVKELVENAIDAGSSAVVVEIRRGGMGMIRVTDNGCGIAPAELPTAFLRHATSKLRSEAELGSIGTLGFRGEALAAISAVSRVDILSCPRGASLGASLHLEGGIPAQVETAGAPEGTTITVRDLFYNTPARLKFMRKDSAETAAVAGLMQHLALSHPDVSFKFIKDGTESLHTPGDGRLDSAVYAALGRDFAKTLLPVEGCGGEVQVSGMITRPLYGRGSRNMQVFFVNGRFIKSQLLTAALEEGYRNQIMKGKFPGCVVSIDLPVTAVDVNVHPAKTQVKFAREREVFDALYHTVQDALAREGGPVAAPKEEPKEFFQRMDAKTFREQAQRQETAPAAKPKTAPMAKPQTAPVVKGTELGEKTPVADTEPPLDYGLDAPQAARPKLRSVEKISISPPPPSVIAREIPQTAEETPVFPPKTAEVLHKEEPMVEKRPEPEPVPPAIPAIPQPPQREEAFLDALSVPAPRGEELAGQTALPEKEAPWRIAGEVLRTYIICESEAGEVYLIDKHAAHERMNFDRLMRSDVPPMRQTLLTPLAVEPGREAAALLLENLPLLERFGFLCEDFGDGTILVREVPADIDAGDTESTLEEFAESLRTGRSLTEKREKLYDVMACKAAIKGGWQTDPAELRVLVDKVQSGEVRYCPHGRPVVMKFTRYQLEKLFKRA